MDKPMKLKPKYHNGGTIKRRVYPATAEKIDAYRKRMGLRTDAETIGQIVDSHPAIKSTKKTKGATK